MKRMIQLSMTLAVLLFLPLTVSAHRNPEKDAFDRYALGGNAARGGAGWIYGEIGLSDFSLTHFNKTNVSLILDGRQITLPILSIAPESKGAILAYIPVPIIPIIIMKIITSDSTIMSTPAINDIRKTLTPTITNIATGEIFPNIKTKINKKILLDGTHLFTVTYKFRTTNPKNDPLVLSISKDASLFGISILSVEYGVRAK